MSAERSIAQLGERLDDWYRQHGIGDAIGLARAVAVDIAIAAVRQMLSEGLGAEKRGALLDDAIARLLQALG